MSLEQRVRDALIEGAAAVHETDDFFARVKLSVAADRLRRSQRRRGIGVVFLFLAAIASVVAATTNRQQGDIVMDWWILELIWFTLMVGLAFFLGPFIRRFGKSYAADVFRANPRTGKSFIVLMDVAYYLVFFAYILFTVQFEPAGDWENTVNANQVQTSTIRVGGILLIVGLLHGLNVLTLPIMGRIFTLNRRLDSDSPPTEER
jgi:hypothetical protein